MNLERIKSVVLVGLVASSMALTFQLFAIEPQKVIDATEQIEISDKIDDKIKDLISPKRIVVNYSEQNHRVFYSDFGVDLWKNTRDLFQNSFFNKEFQIKELDIDSYVDMLSKKSIVYNFGTEIPIDIFFKMN
ncbi:MAG: two-component system activity regulator YycH, partial [Campylobacterales bacterium]|nr:two-component system activity regulator YycH [Campylobacterales bacterium]